MNFRRTLFLRYAAMIGGLVSALLLTMIDTEQLSVPVPAPARNEPGAREALTLARGEPYVMRLVGLSALGAAALLTTDYLFKMTAARSIPAAELGGFFGGYLSGRFLDPLKPERTDHMLIAVFCLVAAAASIVASVVTVCWP